MPSVDTRNVCCLSPQGLPARDEDDGEDDDGEDDDGGDGGDDGDGDDGGDGEDFV